MIEAGIPSALRVLAGFAFCTRKPRMESLHPGPGYEGANASDLGTEIAAIAAAPSISAKRFMYLSSDKLIGLPMQDCGRGVG